MTVKKVKRVDEVLEFYKFLLTKSNRPNIRTLSQRIVS